MIWKVSARSVRANWAQFLMSIVAVLLGVAFISGTLSLRSVLADTFAGIVDSSYTADVYVRGAEQISTATETATDIAGARNRIPLDLTAEIESLPEVAKAVADVSGTLVLVGADGTAVVSTGAPSLAFGVDLRDDAVNLASGKVPENGTEIGLETQTMISSGLELGDETKILIDGVITEVTVVGEFAMASAMAGATLVGLDMDTALEAFAADGTTELVAVTAADGVSGEQLLSAVAAALPTDAQAAAISAEDIRAEMNEAIGQQLGFLNTFLFVFAALSLFVGSYIIANTFNMSVRRRTREFALLRALGVAPAQVYLVIVVQAVLVGIVGALLGIIAGLGLLEVVRAGLSATGMDLTAEFPLTVQTVVIALIIGAVVSVLAALVPARRAALVPPVTAMTHELATTNERAGKARAIVGLSAIIIGAGALVGAWQQGESGGGLLGLGAAALLGGVLLFAPALAGGVFKGISGVVVGGTVGKLAVRNVLRNPKRTANTAGALLIGVALVSAISVMAVSAKSSVSEILDRETRVDFVVQPVVSNTQAGLTFPHSLAQQIAELDQVAHADLLTFGPVVHDEELIYAGAVEPGGLGNAFTLETIAGSAAEFDGGKLAVIADFAELQGWEVGDTLHFADASVPNSPELAVEIGYIFDSQAFGINVIFPQDIANGLGITLPAQQFIVAEPDADLDRLAADLAATVAPYVVISVQDADEFAGSIVEQVDAMITILYALLALSVIIAILGIVNTLAMSVLERTREIGLLRAVGLSRARLAGVVSWESVLIALFAALVGAAVGLAIAAGLPAVFRSQGLTQLVIPWNHFSNLLGGAVVVGLLAALWPALRAARMPVLDAVSSDVD